MYLLVKDTSRLYNVPVRPFVSNCGIPTEEKPKFLNGELNLQAKRLI